MNWRILLENATWRIETTLSGIENTGYSWETELFKVTRKVSSNTVLSVRVNGIILTYNYVSNRIGEEVIIDISDFVRSFNGGVISFDSMDPGGTGTIILTINWQKRKGIAITDEAKQLFINAIPFSGDTGLPFYWAPLYPSKWKGDDGVFYNITVNNGISANLQFYADIYNTGGQIMQQTPYGDKYIDLLPLDCDKFYKLLTWRDQFGYLKSWYWLQDSLTNSYDKSIDIVNLYSGYDVLKNKKKDFGIFEQQATLETQLYLSDIVYSDEVAVIGDTQEAEDFVDLQGNEEVTVSEKKLEIDLTGAKKDISLTINYKMYDTI